MYVVSGRWKGRKVIEHDAESATLCHTLQGSSQHSHIVTTIHSRFGLTWTCLGLCAQAHDIPPDALALLDMNGIDVTRWKRLQHLQYGYDA